MFFLIRLSELFFESSSQFVLFSQIFKMVSILFHIIIKNFKLKKKTSFSNCLISNYFNLESGKQNDIKNSSLLMH